MNTKNNKLVFMFSGLRNLNTDPLYATGLDGDTWDYIIEAVSYNGLGTAQIYIYPNGDSGSTTKRQYETVGYGSTADGTISDNNQYIKILQGGNDTTDYCRLMISGDSTKERYFDSIQSKGGGTKQIGTQSGYWKNTSTNLTSLEFGCIENIYTNITISIVQVPKQSNLHNLDVVDVLDWSSESDTKSFTGLKGDIDEEYFIKWESTGSASVSTNLSGSIYKEQDFKNSNGSLSASNSTSTSYVDALYYDGVLNLKAASGRKRLFTGSTSKTVSTQQAQTSCLIDETSTEVTQINIIPSGSITAKAILYKRKSNKTIDQEPMMTVVEHHISGVDFSAGITINNIEGDRFGGAIKIECFDMVGNTNLTIQANTITSNSNQELKGSSSSTSASSSSPTKPTICTGSTSVNGSETWIYPNSGQNRPCLNKQYYNENTIELNGIWINDSSSELVSLLIQADSTTSLTGKIRILIPSNTKQTSPSWTKTVN